MVVRLLINCVIGDSAWAKELVLDAQRRGLLDSEQTTLLENVLEGEDGVKHLHEKLSAMFSKYASFYYFCFALFHFISFHFIYFILFHILIFFITETHQVHDRFTFKSVHRVMGV